MRFSLIAPIKISVFAVLMLLVNCQSVPPIYSSRQLQMFRDQIREISDTLAINPGNMQARLDRIDRYEAIQDFEAGMADVAEGLRLHPGNVELIMRRGIMNLGLNNIEGALQDIDILKNNHPDEYNGWYLSAIYFAKLANEQREGSPNNLLKILQNYRNDCDRAISLKPDKALLYIHKDTILQRYFIWSVKAMVANLQAAIDNIPDVVAMHDFRKYCSDRLVKIRSNPDYQEIMQRETFCMIDELESLLDGYKKGRGEFPTETENDKLFTQLQETMGQKLQEMFASKGRFNDLWGNPLHIYQVDLGGNQAKSHYRIWSNGPNGIDDNTGNDDLYNAVEEDIYCAVLRYLLENETYFRTISGRFIVLIDYKKPNDAMVTRYISDGFPVELSGLPEEQMTKDKELATRGTYVGVLTLEYFDLNGSKEASLDVYYSSSSQEVKEYVFKRIVRKNGDWIIDNVKRRNPDNTWSVLAD